ncbi:MAG: hypothetical protein ABFD96_25440 [Armatimonadia bacterium]
MIDWDGLLYDKIYDFFGVAAEIETRCGTVAVTVIDQTAGIEVQAGNVGMPSIRAAAMVRVAEIVSAGFPIDSLIDGELRIGATAWTIKNVAPRPGPNGKNTGELQLILINGAL